MSKLESKDSMSGLAADFAQATTCDLSVTPRDSLLSSRQFEHGVSTPFPSLDLDSVCPSQEWAMNIYADCVRV